jgi:hypothetical protein
VDFFIYNISVWGNGGFDGFVLEEYDSSTKSSKLNDALEVLI